MKTTLNEIRLHYPCADGWKNLLQHLGKTKPDDDPLPVLTVLESNGIDDAIWTLRAVKGSDREIRLFAVWCARQVQHLMTDKRSVKALDVSERFANGLASAIDLDAAWDAALAAASDVERDAAWAAAWAAASDVARASAWAAARAAASDVERDAQKQKLIEICDGRANERAI